MEWHIGQKLPIFRTPDLLSHCLAARWRKQTLSLSKGEAAGAPVGGSQVAWTVSPPEGRAEWYTSETDNLMGLLKIPENLVTLSYAFLFVLYKLFE